MKKILAGVVIVVVSIFIIPINAFAAETQNINLEIIKINENKYIIYIQNLQKTEFTYAISNEKNVKQSNLQYFQCTKDEDENQIAVVDNNICNTNAKTYLWIKQGEKQIVSAQELDFLNALSKSTIEEVENTSKKINVEIISDLLEEEKSDENGVEITVKVGGIEIKDTKEAQYLYQIMPANGEYETLMTLAEKMQNEYNETDMYSRIKMVKEFNNKYQELISEANWNSVENMQIRQPKDAIDGTKYVVFIKKIRENEETIDAQFLVSEQEQNPTYERERKVIQETTKLPITGDNLIMIAVFIVIASSAIFVFIKMKKSKKEIKDEI